MEPVEYRPKREAQIKHALEAIEVLRKHGTPEQVEAAAQMIRGDMKRMSLLTDMWEQLWNYEEWSDYPALDTAAEMLRKELEREGAISPQEEAEEIEEEGGISA